MRPSTFNPHSEDGLKRLALSNVTIIDYTTVKKGRDLWYKVKCNDCGKEFLKAKWTFGVHRCQCYKTVNGAYNYQGYKAISAIYFNSCKHGALIRNLEFNITKEDMWQQWLKQGELCALSGIKLTIERNYKKMKEGMSASLDRIDSTKGYTVDNIQWVHKDLNKMKMDYPNEYFIDMCKKIAEFNKNTKNGKNAGRKRKSGIT